jgi:hypothetical protein
VVAGEAPQVDRQVREGLCGQVRASELPLSEGQAGGKARRLDKWGSVWDPKQSVRACRPEMSEMCFSGSVTSSDTKVVVWDGGGWDLGRVRFWWGWHTVLRKGSLLGKDTVRQLNTHTRLQ